MSRVFLPVYWSKPIQELTENELIAALGDPKWRIHRLYSIMDKEGHTVPFRPNEVQAKFIDDLWYRNVVPKARQRGFSTVCQILGLDRALFADNQRVGFIAQDRDTAGAIFNDKIIFAYNNLPEIIREMRPITKKTASEVSFNNNSTVRCATSFRGGTPQFLHISEYGKICKDTPLKAKEIKTGSLPSVDKSGIIIIESTVEGLDGHFTDLVQNAQKLQQQSKKLDRMDYRLHFASWWDAEEYETDPETVVFTAADEKYFLSQEASLGRDLNHRKRAWYVKKRDNEFAGDRESMFSQYPTTLEEAFTRSTEGAWLAEQMAFVRLNDRIADIAYDPTVPVTLWFDIGATDDVACWFIQIIGQRVNVIDFAEESSKPYSFWVDLVNKRGYLVDRWYLPHDADHKTQGVYAIQTPRQMLETLGVTNIEIVPRVHSVVAGIQMLRSALMTMWFDETKCAVGINHLDNLKKVWNTQSGVFVDEMLKNGHQHAADALRQFAQHRDALINQANAPTQSRPKRRNKGAMVV